MKSGTILVVEDDQTVNELLVSTLGESGFNIKTAHDGEQGLSLALNDDFDLILLDVMMPLRDGLSVLSELRKHKSTPVLFLTAKGAEQDRISGFQTGADDYLTKPFNVVELNLRIEAILRRTRPVELSQRSTKGLQTQGIQFDPFSFMVTVNNSEVILTPLEYDLLETLVQQCDEVLTKAYLYQQVLKRNFSQYDRTLDMHVSKIRKKFNASGIVGNVIKTVRGQGYCYDSQCAL